MSKDYYHILGVPRDSSKEEIKRAYFILANQYHPDKENGSEKRFKEINEAYRVLSYADSRAKHDEELKSSELESSHDFKEASKSEEQTKNTIRGSVNRSLSSIVIILVLALVGLGSYVLFSKSSSNDLENIASETVPVEQVLNTNTQPTNTPQPKVVKTQAPSINFELSQNPEYLFSKTFNPNKVKAYGVGIGDLESIIDQSSIIRQEEYFGWVRTVNGVGYRIANGKVVEIALHEMAEKLGIYSESNIIMMFGQPDKIDTTSDYYNENIHILVKEYYYTNKGLNISYIKGGITLIGINVTGIY